MKGYSNDSLFPQDIHTVCVHMFDNRSFRRNMEYDLTDALAKRIEAQTPYKIVSDQDRADTVITGQIVSISDSALTMDRELGEALEKELNAEPLFMHCFLPLTGSIPEMIPMTITKIRSELSDGHAGEFQLKNATGMFMIFTGCCPSRQSVSY